MIILAAIRPGSMSVGILLAAFVIWRWRRLGFENKILGLVAAAALIVYGSGVIHPPSLDEIFLDIGRALGPYTSSRRARRS